MPCDRPDPRRPVVTSRCRPRAVLALTLALLCSGVVHAAERVGSREETSAVPAGVITIPAGHLQSVPVSVQNPHAFPIVARVDVLPSPLPRTPRVLLLTEGTSAAQAAVIQAAVEHKAGIGTLDTRRIEDGLPVRLQLAGYDAVLLAAGEAFMDPHLVGDLLADYIDAGGSVVLSANAQLGPSALLGRFARGGYSPANTGTPINAIASLFPVDPEGPIAQGVGPIEVNAGFRLPAYTLAPTPGATTLMTLGPSSIGRPYVVAKGSVVSLGFRLGRDANGLDGAGDIGRLVANALMYGIERAPWFRSTVARVSLAPGQSTIVPFEIDATHLEASERGFRAVITVPSEEDTLVVLEGSARSTPAPALRLKGSEMLFRTAHAAGDLRSRTRFAVELEEPPPADATVEIRARGPFDPYDPGLQPGYLASQRRVNFVIEGAGARSMGDVATGCRPLWAALQPDPLQWDAAIADGWLEVTASNSGYVGERNPCTDSEHMVQVRWTRPDDHLEFANTMVGSSRTLSIRIANPGDQPLHVTSIESSSPDFFVDGRGMRVHAHSEENVRVRFKPSSSGVREAVLRITSDDPVAPVTQLRVHGVATRAPRLVMTPAPLTAALLPGQQVTRGWSIRNGGGSDLEVDLRAMAGESGLEFPLGVPPGRMALSAGDVVLLVQDQLPYGNTTGTEALEQAGVPYRVIRSEELSGYNLDAYPWIIIAPAQPAGFYANLQQQMPRLEAYVSAGGVLDYRAAAKSVSDPAPSMVLPGGVRYVAGFEPVARLLQVYHPVLSGAGDLTVVSDDGPGFPSSLSHSSGVLAGLPAGAEVLAGYDAARPIAAIYRFGAGRVFTTVLALEEPGARQNALILRNLVAYLPSLTRRWLTPSSRHLVLPPGASAEVSVTLSAESVTPGEYTGALRVTSNAPSAPLTVIPARLTVEPAGWLRAKGALVQIESRQPLVAGRSTHQIASGRARPEGDITIDLEAPVGAELKLENNRVIRQSAFSSLCLTYQRTGIAAPEAALLFADGVLDATVTGPGCDAARQLVRVRWFTRADTMLFAPQRVDSCATRSIVLSNDGTQPVQATIQTPAGVTVEPASAYLIPGTERELVVTVCSSVPGLIVGDIVITSDDVRQAPVRVAVRGEAVLPARITWSPLRGLDRDMRVGQQLLDTLVVTNSGGQVVVVRPKMVVPGLGIREEAGVLPPATPLLPAAGERGQLDTDPDVADASLPGTTGTARIGPPPPPPPPPPFPPPVVFVIRPDVSAFRLQPGESRRILVTLDARLSAIGDVYTALLDLPPDDKTVVSGAIPLLVRVADLEARARFEPRVLERRSKGHWVEMTLAMPVPGANGTLDPASVRLNGLAPSRAKDTGGHDDRHGEDHLRGWRFRFDRDSLVALLPPGPRAILSLSGAFSSGQRFLAVDTVTIGRGGHDDDDDDDDKGHGEPGAPVALLPGSANLVLAPNPFRSADGVALQLALPRAGAVEVRVFSVTGRAIRQIARGEHGAGLLDLRWDGLDDAGHRVEPGLYLVRVQAPGLEQSRRVIMLR